MSKRIAFLLILDDEPSMSDEQQRRAIESLMLSAVGRYSPVVCFYGDQESEAQPAEPEDGFPKLRTDAEVRAWALKTATEENPNGLLSTRLREAERIANFLLKGRG